MAARGHAQDVSESRSKKYIGVTADTGYGLKRFGVDNFGASAVIDCQVDHQTAVGGGGVDRRIKFAAFLLSGAAAALAGLLYSGMMQTARFNFGEGAELMAIAAVILGGTSLFGGRGTILGTFAGSLLIGTINNGLIIMGLDVSEQMMVAGGIIILAVAFGKKPTT